MAMFDEVLLQHILLFIDRTVEVSIPLSIHRILLEDRCPIPGLRIRSSTLSVLVAVIFSALQWNKDTCLQISCVLMTAGVVVFTSALYKGTTGEKLFSSAVGGLVLLLLVNLLLVSLSRLFDIRMRDIFYSVRVLPFLTLCEFLLGNLVRIFLAAWRRRQHLAGPFLAVSIFYPAMSIIVNAMLLFYSKNNENAVYLVGIPVGFLASLVAHFSMMTMLSEQTIQGEQARLQAAIEQERAEALMTSYTDQRRLTHEFTNHMDSLYFMLEQGEVEEAKSYLSKLSKTIASHSAVVNTHNPLLDSLLSKKYEEAAKRGVMLSFDLSDLSALPIEKTDLVIVVSNLLNNAIEAASQADVPEVFVRIKKAESEYVLSVRNRVRENIEIPEGQLPRSTKKESGHGMGLANVCDALERCGAEYTLSCRENWFRFTCAVPACKI